MGGSAETVGFLFMSFTLTQLVATPILGSISDKIGRRRVILVSLAGNSISMVVFALASKLSLLPLLFASRIVAGATAGNLAACQAAISDTTTEQERATGMGRLGAGINLGLIVGPLAGGALSGFGVWAPPLAAAALAFVDLVVAFFFMPETRHLAPKKAEPATARPEPAWRSLRQGPIVIVLLLYFFTFLCLTNMQVALALLAKLRLDWGPQNVAWLFAVFATLSFFVQGVFIGRLARRFREVPLVIVGSVCTCTGMLIVGGAHRAATLVGGVALLGLGLGTALPLLTTLASQSAPDENRGFVLGVAQSSGGLARTIGPVLGGILFQRLAPEAPFVGGAVSALLCVFLALALPRRTTG
jgi:MFS family permease